MARCQASKGNRRSSRGGKIRSRLEFLQHLYNVTMHLITAVRAPSEGLRVLVVRTDFLRRGVHARDPDGIEIRDCCLTTQTWTGMIFLHLYIPNDQKIFVLTESKLFFWQLDLTTLITQKGIPIGLTHLDSYVRAKQYSHTFKTSVRGM